jgi:hypothetical protein
LLESAVGDEFIKMITVRLLGEEVEDASLKNLVIRQGEFAWKNPLEFPSESCYQGRKAAK